MIIRYLSRYKSSNALFFKNKYRKVIFGVCLLTSLAIHISCIAVVLLASSFRNHKSSVTFIDLKDIVPYVPAASQVIQAPAPVAEIPPMPLVKPEPVKEKAESPATLTKPLATDAALQEILETPLGRGMTNGYFSTLAEGRTLRSDIREYYFQLLEKINNLWWDKANTLKDTVPHDGIVEISLGRDGTLYDLRISMSTGSREVDRAILEMLKSGGPFPALPASYELDSFRAPLRITPPLHMFGLARQK